MISRELELALLILGLYGSTCVAFVYANEGVVQQVLNGIRLRLVDDRLCVAGRSPIWLNPFTPMFPAFRGQWGNTNAIASSPGLPPHVAEALRACDVLSPYVFAVFLYTIIGIPAILIFGGAVLALPMAALAYLASIVLMIRLWFLRECFSLSGAKFALLAFESIACLPFAAGVIRRLSLMTPIQEDLASFVDDMAGVHRIRAVASLTTLCDKMVRFYDDESREHARLARYRDWLSSAGAASPAPRGSVGAGDLDPPRSGSHDNHHRPMRQ